MAFSVAEILSWSGGRLANAEDLKTSPDSIRVKTPAPLKASGREDLAYFFSRDYQAELATASPGILITGEAFVKPLQTSGLPLWTGSAVIACTDPYFAMAVLSARFAPSLSSVAHLD